MLIKDGHIFYYIGINEVWRCGMKRLYNQKDFFRYIYIPLLIGIVIGSFLFVYFVIQCGDLYEEGFFQYSVDGIENITSNQLYLFILKRRIPQFLLFFILLNVFSYPVVMCSSEGIFGGYYGYVISQLIYQFGMKGLLYGEVCFFPHYIFYGTGMFLLGKWFYYISEQEIITKNNVKNVQYFFKIFVIIFLLFLGVLWEIKIQKNILKIFYQYLV